MLAEGIYVYYGPDGKIVIGKYDVENNVLVDTVLAVEFLLPDARIAAVSTKQGSMVSKIMPERLLVKADKDSLYYETYYKTMLNLSSAADPQKGLVDGKGRKF